MRGNDHGIVRHTGQRLSSAPEKSRTPALSTSVQLEWKRMRPKPLKLLKSLIPLSLYYTDEHKTWVNPVKVTVTR